MNNTLENLEVINILITNNSKKVVINFTLFIINPP